jgi:hypothetical protein
MIPGRLRILVPRWQTLRPGVALEFAARRRNAAVQMGDADAAVPLAYSFGSRWRIGLLSLIQFFFELCLLRRTPQDLPASSALLGVVFLADLLTGVMLASVVGISPGEGLSQTLVDSLLMLALLHTALSLTRHQPRFVQSATALLASSALLSLIAAVPLGILLPRDGGNAPESAALFFLALVAWSILVMGHILRHTFDLTLGQGIAIAVIYHFVAYALLGGLFAGA